MSARIDKLVPGQSVTLRFDERGRDNYTDEPALFVRIIGEGDERRAEFISNGPVYADGVRQAPYSWEAYRYGGHWAYGSSAQRLSIAPPELCSNCRGSGSFRYVDSQLNGHSRPCEICRPVEYAAWAASVA